MHAPCKMYWKCMLNREQLDSGGGGALSQGTGHDGSFF